MDKIINVPLMKHPVNWLVVWLVCALAGFAWHVVHNAIQGNPMLAATDSQDSQPFNANG